KADDMECSSLSSDEIYVFCSASRIYPEATCIFYIFYSESSSVTVHKESLKEVESIHQAKPYLTLTDCPNEVFEGSVVSCTCVLEGYSSTNVFYNWYNNSNDVLLTSTSRITFVADMYSRVKMSAGLVFFTTCLLFLRTTLIYSHTNDNKGRIKLFNTGVQSNFSKNNITLLNDNLSYLVIRGQFNSSDVTVKTVGFERHTSQESSFKLECIISVSVGCGQIYSHRCYCSTTQDRNIYEIILNTTVNDNDSNAIVRAFMLLNPQDKIYSQNVTLPTIYNLSNNLI
ncbi:hypothetical protein Btru_072647, partial [Bulinus truncatus]